MIQFIIGIILGLLIGGLLGMFIICAVMINRL